MIRPTQWIQRVWSAFVQLVNDVPETFLTKDECVANRTAMTDRYPMDVGQDGMAPRVMQMNVANLYDFLTGAGIHKRS